MMPLRLSRRTLLGAIAMAASAAPRALAAGDPAFSAFLATVRRDAVAQGIRANTADSALGRAEYLPRVIELDHTQPEHTMTFAGFIEKIVTPQKTADGRAAMQANWPLLQRVAQRYNVQPRFIVALWAVESDFGHHMGNFAVVSSLATLAYEGRRRDTFRGELIAALRIIDQGNIRPDAMLGSWAGAMGQCQFMPSTYLNYAVDFDGDGKRNIWSDTADVLGSIANYLSQLGWRGNEGWGRQVTVPQGIDPHLAGLETRRSEAEWGRLGVRAADTSPLPGLAIEASLVMPDGPGGPALLAYENFRTIMKWNRSTYFAASVGLLADSFGAG
jgi:membrane-bound lytic murein transglycosylase B